jgi:hypothetical protein
VQEAQVEIAETYFASGDYPRAAGFYERLTRLDLPEEQKANAEFKRADLLFLAGDFPKALAAAQQFVPQHSGHPLVAEAEYLVVQSLRALHRDEDALKETLRILRAGKEAGKEQPELWTYWRQKTGNDLANDLYAKADLPHALVVYQALAELSDQPAWRWPAVYQIGLCFERLRQNERAAQAYQYLLKQPDPGTAPAVPKPPTPTDSSKDEKEKEEKPEKPAPAAEKPELHDKSESVAAKSEKSEKSEKPAAKPAGDSHAAPKASGPPQEFTNLQLIREMAQWRADHLKWVGQTEAQLSQLVLPHSEPPAAPELRTPADLRPSKAPEKEAAGAPKASAAKEKPHAPNAASKAQAH